MKTSFPDMPIFQAVNNLEPSHKDFIDISSDRLGAHAANSLRQLFQGVTTYTSDATRGTADSVQ